MTARFDGPVAPEKPWIGDAFPCGLMPAALANKYKRLVQAGIARL